MPGASEEKKDQGNQAQDLLSSPGQKIIVGQAPQNAAGGANQER